jgi:hypothetical protein
MKKNKIYMLIALLTTVIIFSVAAICNQCGAITTATTATTTEKAGVEESNETIAKETTSGTTASETTSAETTSGTTAAETTEKEAPTISLEIYEGPTYSAADDICYYRVKATVTGKPAPTVLFSKDDSGGAWGKYKVQINIHRFQPYKLTATATNSVGNATDSINLAWGCGSENRNPEISDIVVPGGSIFVSQQYDISASATDPDGDNLTYAWTVNGGSINNAAANPMKWTTPGAVGDYTIQVQVTDGRGGQATMSKTVSVSPVAVLSMNVPKVTGEGGWLEQNGQTQLGGTIYTGDSNVNKACRGYISFDITGLAGAIINNATLTFNIKQKWGDPSVFTSMWVGVVEWGAHPIVLSDYDLAGIGVQSFLTTGDGNLTCNAGALKTQLQNAITAGKTRFQIRIHMASAGSNNNTWDGFEYNQSGVNLNVNYTH